MRVDVKCGECAGPMVLKRSKYGLFYGCLRWPDCKGTHGAHEASGEPLGTPADRPTKLARIAAHDAFDALWKGEPNSRARRSARRDAYAWIQEHLKLTRDECHIGAFSIEQCERVIALVRGYQR